MPIDERGQGYGPETQRKLEHFRYFLQVHLRVVQAIQDKNDWASEHYFYGDLTAGAGEVDGMAGSPLIFVEEANALAMAWRAAFCEKLPDTAKELLNRLHLMSLEILLDSNGYRVFPKDHCVCLEEIVCMVKELRKPAYGLVYADPNGEILPFEAIRLLTEDNSFQRIDVLFYVSAANHKRVRRVWPERLTLREELERLGKKFIHVRQPYAQHQWAFVFLTNYKDYPQIKKIDFHNINSPQGAAILDRIDRTTDERGGQQGLDI